MENVMGKKRKKLTLPHSHHFLKDHVQEQVPLPAKKPQPGMKPNLQSNTKFSTETNNNKNST